MATLREIKRRIAGVRSTAKITQAMKMVAAAKLRRAQDSINAARPYARALQSLLQDLLQSASLESAQSPLLIGRPQDEKERVVLVVVTSDRGLAGAFNSNLLKFTEARIRDQFSHHKATGRLSVVPIGRKATEYFTKRGYNVAGKYPGIFSKLEFDTARTITLFVTSLYNRGEADRVEIIFNEFRSVVSQKPVAERFIARPRSLRFRGRPQDRARLYLRARSHFHSERTCSTPSRNDAVALDARIQRSRTRRAHDRDGLRYAQCKGSCCCIAAFLQQSAPGSDHKRNFGDRRRCGSAGKGIGNRTWITRINMDYADRFLDSFKS